MAEPDHDRESVDRAFAELVAGYHLTAERPDVPRHAAELTGTELTGTERPAPELTAEDARTETTGTAGPVEPVDTTVLPPRSFPSVPTPPVPPVPLVWRAGPATPVGGPPDERYVPDPLPPLSRPGAPALVGWAGVLFAAVLVLAAGFGLDLPAWLGWVAVTAFIAGSVVLLTQLPRHRPPGAGDGAVL